MNLRITISITIFSAVFALVTESIAQTYLSEIMVEVEHQEGELKDLVSELESNTGFTFAYLDQSLQNRQISLGQPSWQMDDLLKEVSVQAGVSVKRVGASIAVAGAEKDKEFPQLVDESVSQWSVTGSVFTENDLEMPSASILLLDASDSSFVKGAIADDQGSFLISSVAPGTYLIQGRMVGFSEGYSGPFEVKDHHVSIDPMELSESTEELDEVIIVSEKPLFEQKIDRLVINVEGSSLFQGNSVCEILERLPGVSSSPLTIDGKTGVVVMINGKYTRMSGTAYDYLQSTPPQNVERVELITAPSVKYDAEGAAGIINIVLKKNEVEGIVGSFSIGSGYGRGKRILGSSSFSYNSKSIVMFADIAGHHINWVTLRGHDWDFQNPEYLFSTKSSFSQDANENVLSLRTGVEYSLGAKTLIGVMGDFYVRDLESDIESSSFYSIDPGVDSLAMGSGYLNHQRNLAVTNFSITHKFNQQQLDLNLDYLQFLNNNQQRYDYQISSINNDQNQMQDISWKSIYPTHFWIGKLDYQIERGPRTKIEAGVKASHNTFRNDTHPDRMNDNTNVNNLLFSASSDLDENIWSGYGSINTFIGETNLVAGLRYEHTTSRIRKRSDTSSVYRNYGNLFPNVSISRDLTDRLHVNLSYTSRINRPIFLELSPIPVFMEPRTFMSGNPMLIPTRTHTLRLGGILDQFAISFGYSMIYNEKDAQPMRLENEDQVIKKNINFDFAKLFNVNFSFPLILTDWWEMNNHLGLNHKRAISDYFTERQELMVRYISTSSFHEIRISKSISAELTGKFVSGMASGLTRTKSFGSASLGITKEFVNDGGSLNVQLENILSSRIWRYESFVPDQDLAFFRTVSWDNQLIRITYAKKFGNSKNNSGNKRKAISEEELKRL